MDDPDERRADMRWLEAQIFSAFSDAYPGVEKGKLEHMSRNFVQVVQGIIEIGGKVASQDEGITQMDIANGLVYWCVASTSLEDFFSGKYHRVEGGERVGLNEAEVRAILGECVARVSDWLLGLEVLKSHPEIFRKFVKGAVALGASDWERDRSKLRY